MKGLKKCTSKTTSSTVLSGGNDLSFYKWPAILQVSFFQLVILLFTLLVVLVVVLVVHFSKETTLCAVKKRPHGHSSPPAERARARAAHSVLRGPNPEISRSPAFQETRRPFDEEEEESD